MGTTRTKTLRSKISQTPRSRPVCCIRCKARPTRQEQLSSKASADLTMYYMIAQGAMVTGKTCGCQRSQSSARPRALSTASSASTASESLQPSALGAASSMVAASLVAPEPAPVSATIAHESTSPPAWHHPSRACSRGCTPRPQDRFATGRSPPTLAAARPSSCEDHAESIAAAVDSASAT